ncbi:hypothetical protein THRCLA_06395 [Thraustotheca clavata]|uniref:Uncharacterized protein n=1 Tax=Thraustotheca clavata TaxID=74557 RepID=A0A1V9ZP96_9STRA|nr:hypothetical protein THRCLA_06395 [Thraustotheca clavata]
MQHCQADIKTCRDRTSNDLIELVRDPKNNCTFPICPPNTDLVSSNDGSAEAERARQDWQARAQHSIPSPAPSPTIMNSLAPSSTVQRAAPYDEESWHGNAPWTTPPSSVAPSNEFLPTTASATAAPAPENLQPTLAPVSSTPIMVTAAPTSAAVAPSTINSATASVAGNTVATPAPTAATTLVPNQAPKVLDGPWINIDNNHSVALDAAVFAAFAGYNKSSVCDALKIGIVSYEQQAQSYSVVADVSCNLKSESQVAGKYVLHFEEAKPNVYYLSMCGHEQDNLLFNWIGVEHGDTVCQTPAEKNAFATQSVEHVAHNVTTGDAVFSLDYLKHMQPASQAIVGSIVAVLAVLVVLMAVKIVRSRRIKYQAASSETPVGRRRASREDDESKEEELGETASTRSAIAEIEGLMEPSTTMNLRPSMRLNTPMHPTNVDHEAKFVNA